MNHMFTLKDLRHLWLALAFLLAANVNLKATHAMGADLTFQCIGNGQYQVQLQFFRDCGGISPASTYAMTYSSATCGVSASITLTQSGSATDVTPICASASSNCGGGGGSFGIEQWTYTGTLNLPAGCGNDWVLGWSTCCRNNAISTLSNPGNQSFYVYANLDNTTALCNSSPVFVNDPTPIVCINQPVSYSHGVSDPNNDSLVFSLANCRQSAGAGVGYAGGFSGVNPLATSSGVTINPATGTITFTPNATQVGVMCVRVQEFRNGVQIGEVIRDMQFRVINCSNQAPIATGINGTGVYQTDICIGSTLCFDIFGSDVNSDNITMTWNNGIPGGQISFTGQGTTAPSATFCWTPGLADIGSNFFTVTVTDNACPLQGVNTYSYEIIVTGTSNNVSAGSDQTVCEGESANLNATGSPALSYTWTPSTGLSCTNCANPVATPSVTTAYTVTASFADGCNLTDVVNVIVAAEPNVSVNPQNAFSCPGASVLLVANAPTATGYAWSSGGSGSTESVSPAVTTSYIVTVTDGNGCQNTDTAVVNIATPSGTACNVIYTSPGAVGVGSSSDPADFVTAIGMASCNNTVIKMDIGTYTISSAITNVTSFLTIEGGFDRSNGWRKTSQAGATTINRTSANVEGATGTAPRITAFYINGQTDFRFQDLTITTANAPANGPGTRGISTYGVHMTNCTNYNFTRCQILPGNAGQGDSGSNGTNGANGNNGVNGQNGDSDQQNDARAGGAGGAGGGAGAGPGGAGAAAAGGCCSTGGPGAAGGTATNYRAGGGGGGGARGGQEDRDGGAGGIGGANFGGLSTTCGGGAGQESGCNSVTSSCNAALSGDNGCAGAGGANGTASGGGGGGSYGGGFFNPGGLGGTGTDGQGGRGGRGGGGGAGEGGLLCTDGAGASGGGGGGGGQGATGGTGGYGGGTSVALYLFSNGAGGQVVDCNVSGGTAGPGGVGGSGGSGGSGGIGGTGGGDDINDFEIGCGGRGGNGGAGGNGGNGGNGAAGQSISIRLDGGSSLSTNISSFNLAGQPTIFMENISCTASSMDYSTLGSVNWNLGTGASPQTPTGSTVSTTYSSTGRKNIVRAGSNTYTGFANIILGTGIVPQAGTTAPLVAGEFRICEGESVDFQALNPGLNYVYNWTMGGGATPNTYNGTAFDLVTGVTFNTAGDYYVTLQYITDCCGASALDSIHIFVDVQPNVAFAGPTAFCAGDGTGVSLTASGASTYTWTPTSGLNTAAGPTVQAYPPTTTTYTVTGVNAIGNCADQSNVTVTVNDLVLTPTPTNASCGANGVAAVNVTGGSGSYNYDWTTIGQTTASVPTLLAGNYPVVVTDGITGCQDSTVVTVGPGPGLLSPFIAGVTPVTCAGAADGTATIAHSGGTGPVFVYTWIDTTSGAPVGGNGATTTPLPAGTYAVTIFDIGNPGCPGAALVTIPEPIQVDLALVDTTTPYCSINDGIIEVNASGGNGPYVYQWLTSPPQFGDSAIGLLGNVTYQVVATDLNGCDDTLDVFLDCLLPVTWAHFSATPDNNAIRLDWETAAEDNNRGFEVWRSPEADILDFEQIGWVDADPNASQGGTYDFFDRRAVPGITYFYQLQQRDYDGATNLSEIRQAMLPYLEGLIITSYPSPVQDVVYLQFDLDEASTIEVEIVNVTGQQIGTGKTFEVTEGRNVLELNMKGLADGMYFGRVRRNGSLAGTIKLLKTE